MFIDPDKKSDEIVTKYIALVLEGTVKELIRLNEDSANILLSKKTKLIEFDPEKQKVTKGMVYKNGIFEKEETDEKN
jgi:catabolite regulation protein CreA